MAWASDCDSAPDWLAMPTEMLCISRGAGYSENEMRARRK
jgi:hypothetical protein